MPVLPTVAIPVEPELHTPPPVASLSAVAEPVHAVAVPVIVPGDAVVLTVTTLVAVALPHPLVTV